MNFKPELAAKVLDGSKTVTRRPVKDLEKPCRYRVNRSYGVQVPQTDGPGKGRGGKQLGRIAVVSVYRQRLGSIQLVEDGPLEARREGFATVREFFDYWCWLYGEFDPGLFVDRIEFRLLHPDDYPLFEGGRVDGRRG